MSQWTRVACNCDSQEITLSICPYTWQRAKSSHVVGCVQRNHIMLYVSTFCSTSFCVNGKKVKAQRCVQATKKNSRRQKAQLYNKWSNLRFTALTACWVQELYIELKTRIGLPASMTLQVFQIEKEGKLTSWCGVKLFIWSIRSGEWEKISSHSFSLSFSLDFNGFVALAYAVYTWKTHTLEFEKYTFGHRRKRVNEKRYSLRAK